MSVDLKPDAVAPEVQALLDASDRLHRGEITDDRARPAAAAFAAADREEEAFERGDASRLG